jgi:uncharacterized membrane protein
MATPNVVEKWERARIRHSHEHGPIQNVNDAHAEKLSRGQHVADGLANVMGGWVFISTIGRTSPRRPSTGRATCS